MGLDSFGNACIETNSIEELTLALDGIADETDLLEWNMTSDQWVEQIKLAIVYLREQKL